jgi:Delta3-Delta2-enoyl-CoA isomerase
MIETIDHVAVRELRLNRPPVNALSPELIAALLHAIKTATSDGKRALVLSGSPGMFSAGLDVPLLLKLDRSAMGGLWREFYALLGAIASSPHSDRGRHHRACACGLGRTDALLRLPDRGRGRLEDGLERGPGGSPTTAGNPSHLAPPRRPAPGRAASRTRGLLITLAEAAAYGLVDELAPADQVVDRALKWCEACLRFPRWQWRSLAGRPALISLGSLREIPLRNWPRSPPGGGARRRKRCARPGHAACQ